MYVLKMKHTHLIDVGYSGEDSVKYMEKAIQEGDIDRYSLILTDMSMPFMDGYKASERIRRIRMLAKKRKDYTEDPELTIIAITGHVEPEYIKKAKDSGINDVYAKPMKAVDLGQILMDHGFID
jgi:CheY-like chemotaxis protein